MRWLLKSFDKSSAGRLSAELDVPALVAQLLVQRGISDPEAARVFLKPSLDQLHKDLYRGRAAAVSMRTSPISMLARDCPALRRMSARNRASNSAVSNGFTK